MQVAALHYSNSIIDLDKTFGMQVMELAELRELRQRGIDASLWAREVVGEHPHVHAVPYHATDRGVLDLPYYTRFFDLNSDADILQGNCTPLLSVFAPTKTIIRFDGYLDFPLCQEQPVVEAYTRAKYIFVSRFLRSRFQAKYPFVTEANAHLLHNAVDDCGVGTGSDGQETVFLYCSRWVSYKGIDILYDLARHLERRHRQCQLWIAGGLQTAGKEQNPALARLEEDFRQRFGRLSGVKLLGFLSHSELLAVMQQVDVVLFPSLYEEPFGLIPAEAAMAGVPTIAFAVGGVPEVICHGETGLLVPTSRFRKINSKRYIRAVEGVLADSATVKRLGHKARDHALKNFSWDRYAGELLGIYGKILTGSMGDHR
jgi:glycosyltransferase involved in cell wall biosynthesis